MKMLNGVSVIELCTDPIGASIGLRLAHLGATVVRVVEQGVDDLECDKESFESLKRCSKRRDKDFVEVSNIVQFNELLTQADIFIYNINDLFLQQLGVSEQSLRESLPDLILAEYSTYGSHSVWASRDEGDLAAQYRSGITYLSGSRGDGAVPLGVPLSELFCAGYLTFAIEAALYRRSVSGEGCKVSSSSLEALLAIQFEYLTTSFNSDSKLPERALKGGALSYLSAPYGVYKTRDGYFAMSVVPIPKLAEMMGVELPMRYISSDSWYTHRDEIMALFAPMFLTKTNREWLDIFQIEDVWCSQINSLSDILSHEGYRILDLEQKYSLPDGSEYVALKSPYSVECGSEGEVVDRDSRFVDPQRPLDGVVVVDLSQYLSGPSSTLHMADLGATVIKVERPGAGDAGHKIIYGDVILDGDSSSSLSINRNKYGVAIDIKEESGRERLIEIIKMADVVVHNFRPAAIKRLGLDYDLVRSYNKRVIYAEISGYGDRGCWRDNPGQDFILQAISGLATQSGEEGHYPIAVGLPVVDMYAGVHLVEGVLAALYRRESSGGGAHVKVTMLGSVMDMQSDAILAHYWGCSRDNKVDQHLEAWSWDDLFNSPLGESIDMMQYVVRGGGYRYVTTRCPIRIDDNILRYEMGAPRVGEHTDEVMKKFKLI